MAELHFLYGTMASGKTSELIDTYNALNQDQKNNVVILKPYIDNRSAKGYVESRNGKRQEALEIYPQTDLFNLIREFRFTHVLVDEVQFLSIAQIHQLLEACEYVKSVSLIYCFGLLTDFRKEFFASSLELMRHADFVTNISDFCQECGQEYAVYNMRFQNGEAVFHGEQVLVGGDDTYKSVCRKCYLKHEQKAGLKELKENDIDFIDLFDDEDDFDIGF